MFYDVFILLCKERTVSQSEVMGSVGLNRAAIMKWKNGATPNGITLQKLAAYFNVTVDYLLKGNREFKVSDTTAPNEKSPAKAAGEIGFDDFTYAMHNEGKRLTKKQKDALLDMARLLAADVEREENGGGR